MLKPEAVTLAPIDTSLSTWQSPALEKLVAGVGHKLNVINKLPTLEGRRERWVRDFWGSRLGWSSLQR